MSKPWHLRNRGPGFPDGDYAPSLPPGDLPRFTLCPDCNGKWYFVINPLHSGSCEAAHGSGNMTQCLTCCRVKGHFDRYGTIPSDVLDRMTPEAVATAAHAVASAAVEHNGRVRG